MQQYTRNTYQAFSRKQSGSTLFVSLVMLIILTVIGLSAAQRSTLQEQMASNLHVKNLAFNAAESAIGGFMVESHTGNKLIAGHVLFDLRIQGEGGTSEACFDNSGSRVDCDTNPKLDSDHGGAITSKINATVLKDCSPGACGGFSLGGNGGIGCIKYQLDGTGTAGTQDVTTTLVAYEVAACF